MSRKILISLIVIVLLAIAAVYYLFFGGASSSLSYTNQPINVVLGRATVKTIPQSITAIGKIISPQTVMLSTQQAGRVTKIYFHPGETVKKGEVLLQIDSASQYANMLQAQASYKQAKDEYQRYQHMQRLYKDSVSKEVLSEKFAAMRVAKATLNSAVVALNETTIRAPFAGTLAATQTLQNINSPVDSQTESQITVGSYIDVGDNIVSLTNRHHLEVEYLIPQKYAKKIHLGQPVSVTSSAYPHKQFLATVNYISPLLLQTGAVFLVRAVITSQQTLLSPGMFAFAKQVIDQARRVLTVPGLSLIPSFNGYTVYVVDQGKVRAIPVTIGERVAADVAITKGLQPNQAIIIRGQNKVYPGSSVNVVAS